MAAIVIAMVATTAAHAAPVRVGGGALIEVGQPPRARTALDSVAHPWPGIALALSAASTAIPIVWLDAAERRDHDPQHLLLTLGAELFTPAVGHLYAGLARRAGRGVLVRAVGFGVVAAGASSIGYWDGNASYEFAWGHVAMLAGAGIMGASAVWDVVTVSTDVERRNAAWLREHAAIGVGITPGGGPALAMTVRY